MNMLTEVSKLEYKKILQTNSKILTELTH